jgi:hypothetical protein
MTKDFDEILDACVDRINQGDSIEACLVDYPAHAERLEHLLNAMRQTQEAYSFVPSADAKKEARQRFNHTLERLERRRRERRSLFTWPRMWATAAAVFLLVMGGYFGLKFIQTPTGPIPNPEGNFAFLISDEVNAIGDFESLYISISKIGIKLSGESGEWIEFDPEVEQVDLTLLPGDKTQEIWRGDIPEGEYTKVFIQVTDIIGILKETGQTVEVKLPSQKLQLSIPFQITVGSVTSFTYDLTVVATGNQQSGIKYILKPQAGESGAERYEE